MNQLTARQRKIGVIIGGSGLIGGTLLHYFKTRCHDTIDLRAPNSKKVSIRSEEDIKSYLRQVQPDFIINTAMAGLASNTRMSLEINYLGAVHLARAAAAMKIPYIHITTAAALPSGQNLHDDETRDLSPDLSNYAKSKLMAEQTLQRLHKHSGLDFSCIRLAIVYGDHDHKIQGFHRLLFTIVDQSMPFLFTKRGVCHSYSNSRKLPYFIHHIINNRDEFSGQTYNFVDTEPVELGKLIIGIRDHLQHRYPRNLYIPYSLAKTGKYFLVLLLKGFAKLGLVAAIPPELMFLESFYQPQTLNSEKIMSSSFVDPMPEETIFTRLPELTSYYLTRWSELNILSSQTSQTDQQNGLAQAFSENPDSLLSTIHEQTLEPYWDLVDQQNNK